nr:coiled-coil domain-containing protein 174 [Helicoverpa armigera]
MNDGSSKKILFNKSTLFSLKAELLRKQEEVNEKRRLPQHKIENFKPPPAREKEKDQDKDTKTAYKKTFKDSLQAVDTEELEACRKAKLALEKKAELYEHLSDGAGNSQLASRFLVDFNTKKQQEPEKPVEVPPEQPTQNSANDDDEWTEFTDCLGRTRKCHKSDISLFLKRDAELMRAINKDKPTSSQEEVSKPEEPSVPEKEKPLLVQTTNEYLQSLREKWEEKERELLAKDKDIHYQDLLFDEARIHGVGYYSFSTDETERRKQMEELIKRREETLKAQQEAEQVRKKRDELIAARVAAARARQRARAGLPPEEPKDNQKDFTTCLLEFLTQQKNEADAKAKEKENKLKMEQEKERQKLREAYVREWDIGKDGVDGKVKKFREMTQEEYVEQQRDKRINEFAPSQASTSGNAVFDDKGNMVGKKDPPATKTWADVRPRVKTPPPPEIGDVSEITKGLYFSSSSNKEERPVKYRNFVRAQEPTPIIDELEDANPVPEETRTEKRKHDSVGVEVPPPPTFEYYGPTIKQTKFDKPFESDIREAYSQGAKSLETKSSGRQLPKHYDFTFD